MVLEIKDVWLFCRWDVLYSTRNNGFQECVKPCIIAHTRSYIIIFVGRHVFRLVNPEIQIIQGWIIKILLHIKHPLTARCLLLSPLFSDILFSKLNISLNLSII